MSQPLKVTLDTNCIINVLDEESKTATSTAELHCILQLGEHGIIDLAVTTRFQADQSSDMDKGRVTRMTVRLEELPVETVGSLVRLSVSELGGGDVLADEKMAALERELSNVLFPSGIHRASATGPNKTNDVDHLLGHYLNRRDVFITDDKGILKKAETLRNTFGITVMNPSELVGFVKSRLTKCMSALASAPDDSFVSLPSVGRVTFDYSSNDGHYTIGQGIYAFGTHWTRGSDTCIHARSDGENVAGIAIAKGAMDIRGVSDAANYDFSSVDQTPLTSEVLVMRNNNGVYAALRILGITDRTRESENDSLTFEYVINRVGVTDFSGA